MGIIWGEVASGALAKVGQEVRLDQQRARTLLMKEPILCFNKVLHFLMHVEMRETN